MSAAPVISHSNSIATPISRLIAAELGVREAQVAATTELIDEGATIPFIARYRKERTGGLDDTQLRKLAERYTYLTELDTRKQAVLKSISEQGKLSPKLEAEIAAAMTKVELEDLYRPFKRKRRTKATVAKEQGLEPLAEKLLARSADPAEIAKSFVDKKKGVEDVQAALSGAQDIIIERMAEAPKIVAPVREMVWTSGELGAKLVKGKDAEAAKYRDYVDFSEPLEKMPSHRALAMLRGEKEGILKVGVDLPEQRANTPRQAIHKICQAFGIANNGTSADKWLIETAEKAWSSKLRKSSATDSIARLKKQADDEAIKIFAQNLHDLLLAAPAGQKTVMGIDPGIRTGCKVAIVDPTGKLLETKTIYPHEPRKDWNGSLATLASLAAKHGVDLVSIGNGTASRETDKLVSDLCKKMPDLKLTSIIVSEAGASVYSASELAADEFPDLDVSLRGAVSIARRLQDPLAELVKIEAKAIGVGQYQHDVDQTALSNSLDGVVEDCVNAVGVDVNTASAPLLARVAGLNKTLAQNIVAFRDENGRFDSRARLKKVPRMGAKSFEQSAGFLRIIDGKNPLDSSAVHPEAYPVVQKIAKSTGRTVKSLIGDKTFLSSLNPKDFADETFGVPTITDILKELEKPGRDPRPEFKTAAFKDGVNDITDLKPGMRLEGVVTNITAFGAFVDIGVHQDGLVHISQLSDTFINDPRDVVKTGDVVNVCVTEIDVDRKRIGLSMKSAPEISGSPSIQSSASKPQQRKSGKKPQRATPDSNPFSVLAKLKK